MADLHYREKLKTIEKAAVTSDQVPEKAKSFGMGCFSLATILFVLFLLFLGFSLFSNGIYIGAIITFVVALALSFVLYKLWSAPKYP